MRYWIASKSSDVYDGHLAVPILKITYYGVFVMIDVRMVAEDLYSIMNSIDCGCMGDREEACYLEDGSHVVFEEIDFTDEYRMIITKPDGKRIIKRVGYVKDGSDFDESTIQMFEDLIIEYYANEGVLA